MVNQIDYIIFDIKNRQGSKTDYYIIYDMNIGGE
jgi:hypothetical protein